MSTASLHDICLSRRTSGPSESVSGDAVASPVSPEIEMLIFLRGARPDRLRTMIAGDSRPVSNGYSLRQVIDDLHDRFRRR